MQGNLIPPDILYMRFMKNGKIVRVARMVSDGGLNRAYYPSDNPDVFYGEAFLRIDDNSPRAEVKKSELNDEILEQLLDGKSLAEIVTAYEPAGDGEYHTCKRGETNPLTRIRSQVFGISEEEELVFT